MSSDKVNKTRGCRYYGRGHKKHKSGSKGGVGGAGKWSHNKGARKFRIIEVRNYDHYIRESRLVNELDCLRASGILRGELHEFKTGGKTNTLSNFDIIECTGEFNLDGKFKKILYNQDSTTSLNLPKTYKISFR